jgi:hypothetical protein
MLPMLDVDKANHFVYGSIVAAITQILAGPETAFAAVLLVAIGKELYDIFYKKTEHSVADIMATLFGGFVVMAGATLS